MYINTTNLIVTSPRNGSIATSLPISEHLDSRKNWFIADNSLPENSAGSAILCRNYEQDSVSVDDFVFENKSHTIYPPVEFDRHFNMETESVELIGRGPYSDVLVYGSDLKKALQILREEYLPILWEDCLNADSIRMTKRLRTMVNDFRDRVQANDTEGKKSKKWIKTKGI